VPQFGLHRFSFVMDAPLIGPGADETAEQKIHFDYEKVITFKTKRAYAQLGPCLPLSAIFCVPCLLKRNKQWETRAQQLSLTEDGIKYVVNRHKRGCGSSCSDMGRVTKIVPYSNITDVIVEEPAGKVCCCIRNTITRVSVGTTAQGEERRISLVLEGLQDPHEFRRAVCARVNESGSTAETRKALSSAEDVDPHLLQEIRSALMALKKSLKDEGLEPGAPSSGFGMFDGLNSASIQPEDGSFRITQLLLCCARPRISYS